MSTLHVKPAPGLTIRDPDLHDFLPDEGRIVPATSYWQRRLEHGDVVAVGQSAEKADDKTPKK